MVVALDERPWQAMPFQPWRNLNNAQLNQCVRCAIASIHPFMCTTRFLFGHKAFRDARTRRAYAFYSTLSKDTSTFALLACAPWYGIYGGSVDQTEEMMNKERRTFKHFQVYGELPNLKLTHCPPLGSHACMPSEAAHAWSSLLRDADAATSWEGRSGRFIVDWSG